MSVSLANRLAQQGLDWIVPVWDAPPNVQALSTTRNGGVSEGARASFDIGAAVPPHDAEYAAVRENRRRLAQFLPSPPVWLSQVHGTSVAVVDSANCTSLLSSPPTADSAVTRTPGIVLGVRSADCLPVVFADRAGTVVGAAHAGWRGLAAGVLEATLRAMRVPTRDVVAWMGPAIGPRRFEVGRDVYDAYCVSDPGAASCFAPHGDNKWLADLYGLARRRLQREGVVAIFGGDHCTRTEANRFFSYRADRNAGRMATLVWLATSTHDTIAFAGRGASVSPPATR
jgi:YfiH family protein